MLFVGLSTTALLLRFKSAVSLELSQSHGVMGRYGKELGALEKASSPWTAKPVHATTTLGLHLT